MTRPRQSHPTHCPPPPTPHTHTTHHARACQPRSVRQRFILRLPIRLHYPRRQTRHNYRGRRPSPVLARYSARPLCLVRREADRRCFLSAASDLEAAAVSPIKVAMHALSNRSRRSYIDTVLLH